MSHIQTRFAVTLAALSLAVLAQPVLAGTAAKPHGMNSGQAAPAKTDNSASPALTDAQKRAQRAQAAAYRKAGGCAKSKSAFNDADFSFQGFGDSGTCSSARH